MNDALQLSEFLEQIQNEIRTQFSDEYAVVAEIASMSGSRHLYFELIEKEAGKILAKCRANLWAFNRYRVIGHFERTTRETLKAGMKVLIKVKAEFHIQYGFSLTIIEVDPSYSLGEFERLKQETLQKLEAEGLLELNKMQELPLVLKSLAIVSSETAAGYQDFIQQLKENPYGYSFSTTLFPCLVQGEQAPESILNALNQIERKPNRFDAIVLIRGGGSVIDLSCFDDYELNFNLAQSSYPVLTGIGHDRDQSVADLVAHTFLKTPTAVAEFIVNHNAGFEQSMLDGASQIAEMAQLRLGNWSEQLQYKGAQIQSLVRETIYQNKYVLQDQGARLNHGAKKVIQDHKHDLREKLSSMESAIHIAFSKASMELDRKEQEVNLMNPVHLFERGYTLTLKDGLPIQKDKLRAGDEITTLGKDYEILSEIKKIK